MHCTFKLDIGGEISAVQTNFKKCKSAPTLERNSYDFYPNELKSYGPAFLPSVFGSDLSVFDQNISERQERSVITVRYYK